MLIQGHRSIGSALMGFWSLVQVSNMKPHRYACVWCGTTSSEGCRKRVILVNYIFDSIVYQIFHFGA